MTANQNARSRPDHKKDSAKTNVQAPWPDQKARQEMSEAELAREDGKHEKNADWKKTW
jgi:hypothetical protein